MKDPMPLKILMLVPTHDQASALWAFDFANMCMTTTAVMPPDAGHELGMYMVTHTYIHRARQELAEIALQEGATHLLWIDADMRFPANALLRLLQHEEKVVGINYAKRGIPSDYVAIKKIGTGRDPGEKLVTDNESTGLEEVEAMGMGLVLMTASVFNEMPDPVEEPWFWFRMTDDGGHVGEDVHFFQMLRDRGHKIYVDHDLSKACSHVGSFEYRTQHAMVEYYAQANGE